MSRFSWRSAGKLGALVFCCALCVGCGGSSNNNKRIVFLINTEDPFWSACHAGLDEGAKQFDIAKSGLEVSWQVNDGTAPGQIEKLRQFGTQSDVAAVAISVIQADNEAIATEMKKLRDKGIKVITVDGDINTTKFPDARSYYIGTNNKVAGGVLGQCVKTLLEHRNVKTGGYVQFAGFKDNDNARQRMDGVKDALGADYSEIDRMPDQTDKVKARENVRTAIANHCDNLVALIGIWAYNAPAIAEVVDQSKLHDKVLVGTFDAQAAAITALEEGKIDVMVVQNPFEMGVQTVRLLKGMVAKDDATIKEMFPNPDDPAGKTFTTGLRVVVPDADSPIKADQLDAKVVEFMPLSKFKEWLKKNNLKSS